MRPRRFLQREIARAVIWNSKQLPCEYVWLKAENTHVRVLYGCNSKRGEEDFEDDSLCPSYLWNTLNIDASEFHPFPFTSCSLACVVRRCVLSRTWVFSVFSDRHAYSRGSYFEFQITARAIYISGAVLASANVSDVSLNETSEFP